MGERPTRTSLLIPTYEAAVPYFLAVEDCLSDIRVNASSIMRRCVRLDVAKTRGSSSAHSRFSLLLVILIIVVITAPGQRAGRCADPGPDQGAGAHVHIGNRTGAGACTGTNRASRQRA